MISFSRSTCDSPHPTIAWPLETANSITYHHRGNAGIRMSNTIFVSLPLEIGFIRIQTYVQPSPTQIKDGRAKQRTRTRQHTRCDDLRYITTASRNYYFLSYCHNTQNLPTRACHRRGTGLRNLPHTSLRSHFLEVREGLPHPVSNPWYTLHVEGKGSASSVRQKAVIEDTSISE